MKKEIQLTPWQAADSIEIKRSEINFAPYNARRIKDKNRALLKKNIKSVGLLGGLVWNKTTGNLVSGHQRVSILDELNDYPANDYMLRVEVVEMDEKQEKEQNLFLNNANAQGEYDSNLLAAMIGEIDYKLAGFDESDLKIMNLDTPNIDLSQAAGIQAAFSAMHAPDETVKAENKEKVKAAKAEIKQNIDNRFEGDPFVTLTFSSFENKAAFMERFSLDHYEKHINGEQFNEILDQYTGG